MVHRYPIYIPSKGRWQHSRRLTSRSLVEMGVRHFMVVESQEYVEYAESVDHQFVTLLKLDPSYQRDYDACMELSDGESRGSGPARNFAWDHAKADGHARYWCVDDNIAGFLRLVKNLKTPAKTDQFFLAMEDFVDRYTNVAMAGPNYAEFAKHRQLIPPFIANTRIFSCNLIDTSLPFRWRGRYNEDAILSLDLLKAGWCTVQFNAFLQNKVATQTVKGGNTDTIYASGTKAKSEMLKREHPDVTSLVWKFGRHHHHVDYRPFKANRLKRKPGLVIPEGPNEYGMRLVHLTPALHEAAD